jgi:hypothetical protein
MKVKYLLLSMLAAFALLSCAKENGANVPNSENLDGDRYIAVKFAMPGTETRATGDFVKGTDAEVAVTKAVFLFYNGENQVADPCTINTFSWDDVEDGTDLTESKDKKSDAVIVLHNSTATPSSIVAILNPDETIQNSLTRSLTMTNLKDLYGTWNDDDHTASGSFVMANSVYVDESSSSVVIGTPLTISNIFENEADALENPIEIYVEKDVAKVTVSASEFNDTTDVTTNVDGTDKKIIFTPNKWWVDHDPSVSTLVKPLSASYTFTGTGTFTWNDPSNFRSYWADQYTTNVVVYQHYKIEDGADLGGYIYTLENSTGVANDTLNASQIVVEGTLSIAGSTDSEDFVQFRTTVYTKADFETILVNNILANKLIYVSDTADDNSITYSYISKDDVTVNYAYNNSTDGDQTYDGATIKDYQAVTSVVEKTGVRYLVKDGDTYTEISGDDLTSAFSAGTQLVSFFNGGKTYYFFKIQHCDDLVYSYTNTTSGTAYTRPLYGVIRNHLYKVNITGVKGVGTAIPHDGSETIVPENPENPDSYIAATIYILKYREVDFDQVLGN